jgi:carbonic anhydrase/acetyltransferase-like protein (isoleucine patch superfamily)
MSLKHATILPFEGKMPQIDSSAIITPNVSIIGDVEIGARSNIWFGCVLRGDVNEIRVGEDTNIQDCTVIHVATHGQGSYIGNRVTIGHSALIHACTIEDDAFVGMQACVMDGAKLEKGAMLAAGALLTPGKTVPSGQLWAGRPARYVRDLNDDDRKTMQWSWAHYVKLAQRHDF